MRWSLAGVVALALGSFFPSSAMAATRYVAIAGSDAGDCTNAVAPCRHVGYAVAQAASGDTIQIGSGTFTETINTSTALNFVGAGGGAFGTPPLTTIRGPTGSPGLPAMELRGGGSLRSLRVDGGEGSAGTFGEPGGDAIDYSSVSSTPTTLRLEGVVVRGGKGGASTGAVTPGPAGAGIEVKSGPGAVSLSAKGDEFAGGLGAGGGGAIWVIGPAADVEIADSRIPDEASFVASIVVFSGARLTLDSVDADAGGEVAAIYDGSAVIRRSRLHANSSTLYADPLSNESPEVEIVDSLVVSDEAEALNLESEPESSVAARVLGSTLIGHGTAAVTAVRKEGAGPATATLRNTIAWDLPFLNIIPPVDLRADGAEIDADFSSFTTRLEENGGTVTPPGSAHNVAGDPAFVDRAHGIYVLQNSSPLIDRGDPGVVQPGELDLLGSARSQDGNRDCLAAPDIGAYEVAGLSVACANARPTISGFGMTNRVFAPAGARKGKRGRRASSSARRVKHGTRFLYTLSEPARVAITIERIASGRKARHGARVTRLVAQKRGGRQSTPFSGRVGGKPLKPGRYRARIVATDAAGQASDPRQVSFRIVSG